MKRKKFPRGVYAVILLRQGFKCDVCRLTFMGLDPIQYDHHIGLHEGGEDHPANLRALCIPCHKKITKRQAQARGKVRRLQQKRGPRLNAKQRAWAKWEAKRDMP